MIVQLPSKEKIPGESKFIIFFPPTRFPDSPFPTIFVQLSQPQSFLISWSIYFRLFLAEPEVGRNRRRPSSRQDEVRDMQDAANLPTLPLP